MASIDATSAQSSHVPYVCEHIASTRRQGGTIWGENDREENTQPAAFGCLGLFPALPVPQTQAAIIAHTGNALPIRSKGYPTYCPEAAAQRFDLLALRHIPDPHCSISTARGQELAVLRCKGQGPDGTSMPSQQLALCARHWIPQTNRLVITPRSQKPTIRGESDSEHLPGMACQRTHRPLSMAREGRGGCKSKQGYDDYENQGIKAPNSFAARGHNRPFSRSIIFGRHMYCSDYALEKPAQQQFRISELAL